MTRPIDLKRAARLERAFGKLLSAHDRQTAGPEVHPCTAPSPTKGGEPCGRWLGTVETPAGWRCVNHRSPKVPRLRNPRDCARALERLEPTLRGLLGWLDAHRKPVTSPEPTP